MKSLKIGFIVLASTGLLFLAACSDSNKTTTSTSEKPDTTETTAKTKIATKTEKSDHKESIKGGQVVESGAYHLEFVPEKEETGTHIDFYLLKGKNHETISNANVTAQVQTPNGTQKMLNLKYDKEGKHYTVLLPEKSVGQYQLKIIAAVDGKKVDGRFSFNK